MMITFEQALKCILDNTRILPKERVRVENSVGRILIEDVYSTIEMPPFNKSAMDGYALKAVDIKNVPVKLKNIGLIQAGQMFRKKAGRGECVKIMTGAALPQGADTVVMVEDTKQYGAQVEINRTLKRGKNVCVQGEDIKKGQKLLNKGMVLSTSDVAVLATTGRQYIKVIKEPKVALLNTGGEIVPTGRRLKKRQIYNSNGPQFLALLKADRLNTTFLGIAKDRPAELKRAVRKGLEYDVFLISGGVSMGDYDLVPEVLKSLGVKEVFHGVKTKPGRPLLFATKKNSIVFGIPGNPVSNFLVYYIYIRPALYKMRGYGRCEPKFAEGIVMEPFRHKPGRRHFVPVKIFKKGARRYLSPVKSHGSADILALSKADGFMVVSENTSVVKKGSKANFITWKGF